MGEPIVRGIGTYDEEYLFHRATGLGKDAIAESRRQEPSAVLVGPEGRAAEFHRSPLERALSYPMAEGQPKPEERTLQVLRFAEENNSQRKTVPQSNNPTILYSGVHGPIFKSKFLL